MKILDFGLARRLHRLRPIKAERDRRAGHGRVGRGHVRHAPLPRARADSGRAGHVRQRRLLAGHRALRADDRQDGLRRPPRPPDHGADPLARPRLDGRGDPRALPLADPPMLAPDPRNRTIRCGRSSTRSTRSASRCRRVPRPHLLRLPSCSQREDDLVPTSDAASLAIFDHDGVLVDTLELHQAGLARPRPAKRAWASPPSSSTRPSA